MQLSIVIPALNEADNIVPTLHALAAVRRSNVEVVVVDGGSTDETAKLAEPLADCVIHAPAGRAAQMNHGAAVARGEVLLFLHADTRLPPNGVSLVLDGLHKANKCWGRFNVTIEGRSPLLKLVAVMMNIRSRITGIATGDQALFVRRDDFMEIGGFPPQPLMEDIEISKRLKKCSAPLCLKEKVRTSGRRWEKNGVLRTTALMWRLRFRYWRGTAADILHKKYR
jgi:rSAM/selenodomain-associated transferase 2